MITLTPQEAEVYEAYLETGKVERAMKKLGMSEYSYRRRLYFVMELGLLERIGIGVYKPTGETYEIREDAGNRRKAKYPVQIAPDEADWMRRNYKRYWRNRDVPAKALGRSRLEINFMALELGLNIKEC